MAEADPWFNFHTKSGRSTSFRTDGCCMRNLVVDLTNAAKLVVYEDEFSHELQGLQTVSRDKNRPLQTFSPFNHSEL